MTYHPLSEADEGLQSPHSEWPDLVVLLLGTHQVVLLRKDSLMDSVVKTYTHIIKERKTKNECRFSEVNIFLPLSDYFDGNYSFKKIVIATHCC